MIVHCVFFDDIYKFQLKLDTILPLQHQKNFKSEIFIFFYFYETKIVIKNVKYNECTYINCCHCNKRNILNFLSRYETIAFKILFRTVSYFVLL